MGRSEAAGRRAGRHLRICMAERTESEGGSVLKTTYRPTTGQERERVSGNATEGGLSIRHCPSTSPADRRRDASEKDGRTASTRRRLSSPSLQLKADRRPFTATKIMEDEAKSHICARFSREEGWRRARCSGGPLSFEDGQTDRAGGSETKLPPLLPTRMMEKIIH